MTNPLRIIRQLGQSVWYDNVSRELLESGELERMIREDGITGVTSNPTIFQKAISQDRVYESALHALVDNGLDVTGIYEALALRDIQDAADLLKPVFEETEGHDGFVSLEVSPHLAYDSAGTIAEARRLFDLANRRNVMIKVPGTPQGLDAFKVLISEGININVTLLFSLEQYRNVVLAYIEGLESRVSADRAPGDSASVASFFVSRIDTMVDERLKEVVEPRCRSIAADLQGKTAIASARLAYAMYKEIFHGERFRGLREKGARPQRIVWASTSTKNPAYSDTMYVDALIGPETINTMPACTVDAYRRSGNPAVRVEQGVEEARAVFEELADLGMSMEEITDHLLEDGVKAFSDSFDELLQEIDKRRTRLLRGWGHRSASLGDLQASVDAALARLDQVKTSDSIWDGDASIWSDDPGVQSKINQRLGWLQSVETMIGERKRLEDFTEEIRSVGFDRAVLLGMGGSSLASEVFFSCFGSAKGYLDLTVLDTTVPGAILDLHRSLDLDRTLFIVSSKSGGTVEVMSLYRYFRSVMERHLGERAGDHFIAITDPGTGLGKLAAEQGFRKTFLNPPDVGGRFSALSYFGLVPAALIGADLHRLLMRASQAVEVSGPGVSSLESPGAWLGAIIAESALRGKDKLTLIVSPGISTFAYWVEQLVAESTGKNGKGILPIEGEPVGEREVYGDDRLFVYLRMDGDCTYDGSVSALEQAGQPVVTLRLHGPQDLGREMIRWEFATAVAGAIMQINPFDEPNVQEAKDITNDFLNIYRAKGNLPDTDRLDIYDSTLDVTLADFFGNLKSGDYLAVNAFVRSTEENRTILTSIRTLIRDRFRIATAVGFGPRYLHSTGQIHKGGPATGHFLMVTCDDAEDLVIPGVPYSFGVLKSAQAMGDYEALKKRNRPILRVHLKTESDLTKLLEAVKGLV